MNTKTLLLTLLSIVCIACPNGLRAMEKKSKKQEEEKLTELLVNIRNLYEDEKRRKLRFYEKPGQLETCLQQIKDLLPEGGKVKINYEKLIESERFVAHGIKHTNYDFEDRCEEVKINSLAGVSTATRLIQEFLDTLESDEWTVAQKNKEDFYAFIKTIGCGAAAVFLACLCKKFDTK